MKNRKDYEEPSLIIAIWVLFLLVLIFAGLMTITHIENSELKIERDALKINNNELRDYLSGKDYPTISKENADKFCQSQGYTWGWPACGINFGFTCADNSVENLLRTKCYSINDVWHWVMKNG